MEAHASLFWQDLHESLKDSETKADFVLQSLRIATIDRIINSLDETRKQRGLSKAQLARAVDANPAMVRRLFAAHGNPTLATVAQIAGALGLELTLVPLSSTDSRIVSDALHDVLAPIQASSNQPGVGEAPQTKSAKKHSRVVA